LAVELVVATAPVEGVEAVLAAQVVVPRAAADRVVPVRAAADAVVAAAAVDHVARLLANDHVVARRADDRRVLAAAGGGAALRDGREQKRTHGEGERRDEALAGPGHGRCLYRPQARPPSSRSDIRPRPVWPPAALVGGGATGYARSAMRGGIFVLNFYSAVF